MCVLFVAAEHTTVYSEIINEFNSIKVQISSRNCVTQDYSLHVL